jgi:hypothetical protein
MLIQMTPQQVTDNWPTILHIIKPALRSDNKRSATDLIIALGSGMMQAYIISDKAKGIIVTSQGLTKGKKPKMGLWVLFAAGEVLGGPHARVKTMRQIMSDDVIPLARSRGCKEVIIEAGRWAGVLNDFRKVPKVGGMTLRKAV